MPFDSTFKKNIIMVLSYISKIILRIITQGLGEGFADIRKDLFTFFSINKWLK
jgi:hypothetical protein